MKILRLGQAINSANSPSPASELLNEYSLEFDGSNDRCVIGDDDIFSFTTGGVDEPFSFSLWAKISGSGSDQGLIGKDAATGSEYIIALDSSDKVLFRLYDADTTNNYIQVLTDAALATGTWIHIVCTYDGSETQGGLTIYTNGIAPGQTASTTGLYNHGMDNTIAALSYGVWDRARSFYSGHLDELSCWDKELSSHEVTSLYNSGKPTDVSSIQGLIGWWRNGDTAGTSVYPTIQDYSGLGNDATMTNMASGDIVTVVP